MYLHDVLAQRRTHAIERLVAAHDPEWLSAIHLDEASAIVDSVIAAILEDGDPRLLGDEGPDSVFPRIHVDAGQYRAGCFTN